MNAVVIELARGRDRKLYPAQLPRPRAELNRIRWLVHEMRCGQGLSYRRVQADLLAGHGIRRSLGAIHKDVARFECPRCAGQPAEVAGG